MPVSFYSDSDFGRKRRIQEDSHFAGVPLDENSPISHVLVVADGMGGHEAGEIASSIARDTIKLLFVEGKYKLLASKSGISLEGDKVKVFRELLREAFFFVHKKIKDGMGSKNMGTTCTVALILKPYNDIANVIIGNIGDSRAYIIRQGKIKQITEDDSVVWRLYKSGRITKDQIRTQKGNNVITQALGGDNLENPGINVIRISKQDIILLSTDGLHGLISDRRIYQIAASSVNLEDLSNNLIFAANRAGGKDNIAVALYSENMKLVKKKRPIIIPVAASILLILVLSALIYLGVNLIKKEKDAFNIEQDSTVVADDDSLSEENGDIKNNSEKKFKVILKDYNPKLDKYVNEKFDVSLTISDPNGISDDLNNYEVEYSFNGKVNKSFKYDDVKKGLSQGINITSWENNELKYLLTLSSDAPGQNTLAVKVTRPKDNTSASSKLSIKIIQKKKPDIVLDDSTSNVPIVEENETRKNDSDKSGESIQVSPPNLTCVWDDSDSTQLVLTITWDQKDGYEINTARISPQPVTSNPQSKTMHLLKYSGKPQNGVKIYVKDNDQPYVYNK